MISTIRHNNRSEIMGRTTRVFGARVLRSGRRVWTGPALETVPEEKHIHNRHAVRSVVTDGSEELNEKLGNAKKNGNVGNSDHDCKRSKRDGGKNGDNERKSEVKTVEMEVDERNVKKEGVVIMEEDKKEAVAVVDRKWGNVYERRKRKRETSTVHNGYTDSVKGSFEVDVDRKFGRQFVRRKTMREAPPIHSKVHFDTRGSETRLRRRLAVVVEPCGSASGSGSGRSSYWFFSCFVDSVLRYLRKDKLGLQQLLAFVCSEPIVRVYSDYGVRFLQDACSDARNGICVISGVKRSIPVFSVNFSALPFCFLYLHSSLHIRYVGLLHGVKNSMTMNEDNKEITAKQEHPVIVLVEKDLTEGTRVWHQTFGLSKLKNGRSIQKRRSSRRSKRGRPPSNFRMQKGKGSLSSELFRSRHNRIQLSPLASSCQLRSSTQRNSNIIVRELKSSLIESTWDIDANTCSANILIIESDKCYRVEEAIVALEQSESKQWFLTVKKDGVTQYSIRAQKVMRPCNTNRITHAMLWIGDNSWKLEFPNRQDWWIFKELYKKCFDKNLHTPIPSAIPVPCVCEVEGYGEGVPFVRPDSYISVKDDELSRALVKRTAIYDMDADDEVWLNKLNSDTCGEIDLCEYLSADRFELMIDAFEKAVHCNPDDVFNEVAAFRVFPDIERRIVEAVYNYWSKKRKQNRLALIRIFQCYQPRKTQIIPKSIFRKKRSFKRQGSQAGRGKQRNILHAMAAEQDAMEQKNAILKVQEAKTSASRSEGMAIEKRQRAQMLMSNADLATYRAAIAIRISEAAQIAESLTKDGGGGGGGGGAVIFS